MSEEQTYGLVRQLPFRSALLAKLNLIVWAAGGKQAAARQLGVDIRTMFGWFGDATKVALSRRSAKLVDDGYAVAFEKRLLHQRKLSEQRAQKQAGRD